MKHNTILKKLGFTVLLSGLSMAFAASAANAGECSIDYTPQYVRMADTGVYRNDWRTGRFIRLNNWNDVVRLYGVPVSYAQAHTCGCTNYAGNPPRHSNSTCQRALDSGIR